MCIIISLKREISYKQAHGYLQVYVFNHGEFVMEVCK